MSFIQQAHRAFWEGPAAVWLIYRQAQMAGASSGTLRKLAKRVFWPAMRQVD